MVYRVYVEKKPGLRHSADSLKEEIRAFLGIQELTDLRLFNRYDVEGIDKQLFDYAVGTVFSEPQQDETLQNCLQKMQPYLLWNICPVSMTSAQTLLHSASRSSLRATVPPCAMQEFTCCTAL